MGERKLVNDDISLESRLVAPRAFSVRLGFCPECEHPHILLLDENNDLLADAVMDAETIRGVMEQLEELQRRGDERWQPLAH